MRTLSLALVSMLLLTTLTAQAQDLAAPPESALLRTTGPRLRMGFDLAPFVGANADRPTMGISTHLRAGVQVNDYFGLYYQAGGTFGGGVEICILYCASTGSKELLLHTSSLMGELTVGDLFQVAMGPTLGIGRDQGVDVVVPGVTTRVAFSFGGDGIGTRRGFSIGAQLDALYGGAQQDWNVVGSLTLGFETF